MENKEITKEMELAVYLWENHKRNIKIMQKLDKDANKHYTVSFQERYPFGGEIYLSNKLTILKATDYANGTFNLRYFPSVLTQNIEEVIVKHQYKKPYYFFWTKKETEIDYKLEPINMDFDKVGEYLLLLNKKEQKAKEERYMQILNDVFKPDYE